MLPITPSTYGDGLPTGFALAFTLMAVTAAHAPSSFPPVWSGILDLNQGLSPYQRDTLPAELMPDEASPVPSLYT